MGTPNSLIARAQMCGGSHSPVWALIKLPELSFLHTPSASWASRWRVIASRFGVISSGRGWSAE
jgi:hypothetical protein